MNSTAVLNYEALVRRDAEGARQEISQNIQTLQEVASKLAAEGSQKGPRRKHALKMLGMLLTMAALPKAAFNAFFAKKVADLPSKWPGLTLSALTEWVAYFEAAGIKHIPAKLGPRLTTEELEQTFEDLDGGRPIPEFLKAEVLPWIHAVQTNGMMWRFEECAPQTIKEVLGCIRPKEFLKVTKINVPFAVDSRVLHCHWDYKKPHTHLVARPWVNPVFEAGFPVEFRVFRMRETLDGKPCDGWAATNYYVQRPLPEKYRGLAEKAIELTKQLEAFGSKTKVPGQPAFPTSGYTVDWLLREDGELVAIEAGPPCTHRGGAHPCCFSFEGLQPGRIVLAGEPGSQFYCPPEVQVYVDRIKAGDHPTGFDLSKNQMLRAISYAAIQGDVNAQQTLKRLRSLMS